MVASVITVRAPGASWPVRGGMRLDDAAGALAVRDRHDDGVRVGAGELGAHRHRERAAEPVGHVDDEAVVGGLGVVDGEVAEGVGVVPRAVPRVEAVGDDVARLARGRAPR